MSKKASKSGSSYSYFKQLFLSSPELLKEKSNAVLLARYRADHGLGEDTAVEQKVINNLSNLKSVLRKQLRKRGRPKGSGSGQLPNTSSHAPSEDKYNLSAAMEIGM